MNITNQKNTEARERGTKEPACLDYRNNTTHPQKKNKLKYVQSKHGNETDFGKTLFCLFRAKNGHAKDWVLTIKALAMNCQ